MTKPKARPAAPVVRGPSKIEEQLAALAEQVAALSRLNEPIPEPVVPVKTLQQQSSSYVVRWIVALFLGYVGYVEIGRYRAALSMAQPEVSVPVINEDATWVQLSSWVKSGRIESTGELLSVAKQLGLNTDRLKPLIDKPARITDANRQSVLDLIGGVK